MPKLLSKLPESSRHRGAASRAGTAASVVAHAALITLAVVATAVSTPVPPHDPRVTVIPLYPPPPPHRSTDDGRRTTSGGLSTTTTTTTRENPLPVPPPIDIDGIPDPGAAPSNPIGDELGTGAGGGGTSGGPGTTGPAIDDGTPFDARVVEVPAALRPGSPVPRYPDVLRSARVEGRVVARFIVDTAGRVEPASVRIVSSSDPLFTSSVRATLPALRFSAAQARGRKVRQYVELPFEFAMDR